MLDDDFPDFPVILGFGACHSLTEDAGRVFGGKGARIRVRVKPRPIGFHLPTPANPQGRGPAT